MCSAATGGSDSPQEHSFDFLVGGELLRAELGDHVTRLQLSTEEVSRIECVRRDSPPSLSLELEHRDWVSAVHCCRNM